MAKNEKSPEKSAKREAFDKVVAMEAEVNACKQTLANLVAKRSEAVKAILDAYGAGPFSLEGNLITVSHHKDTYFFKRPGKNEIDEV